MHFFFSGTILYRLERVISFLRKKRKKGNVLSFFCDRGHMWLCNDYCRKIELREKKHEKKTLMGKHPNFFTRNIMLFLAQRNK
jgi:hypothetical protein